jgi:acid phosphatase family membrane protein YuiD
MNWLSPYLIALVAGWLLAHIVKYTIAGIRGKRLDFAHQLFISGGMPSSHATTSFAVWTVILLTKGFDSAIFGLATVFVLIVAYDAVKVRRSSGEQGDAIVQLIHETKSSAKIPRVAKGHTPLEVLVGSLFGVCIGIIVFLATR